MLDLGAVEVLLCDADGNLFPSEEPAFVASAEVTNRLMKSAGSERRFEPEALRLATTGKNFRTTAADLLAADGLAPLGAAEMERWVALERERVTAHLGATLRPDPAVTEPLRLLAAAGLRLAAVSSSALARLEACFVATEMEDLIPAPLRFSAEDSLPVPTSKPDPAIYGFAGVRLGVAGARALAVEDSVPGALSAVAAGFPTVGNVQFVPAGEQAERSDSLRAAGVAAVVSSWAELAGMFDAAWRPGSSSTASTAASRTTRARSTRSSPGVSTPITSG